MIIPSILKTDPILWPLLIVLAAIYIIPRTPIHEKVEQTMYEHYEKLPEIRVDFHPSRTFRDRFSTNRTALYIETRDEITFSTPLLLHMTQVVPPEWRFLFIGTPHLLKQMTQSTTVRRMIESGKLRLENVNRWKDTWKGGDQNIHETHSRLLTNITFYDEQLPGVEWLLAFRSSAIMCASANRTVNHYLDYDWVGAPWNKADNFGGNGGLSLRRISKVRQILKFQARYDNQGSEDTWLSHRLGLLPGSNCANATIEQGFAVEDIWAERPLGYHLNPNLAPGASHDVWDVPQKRRKIYQYCPEIKMIMPMRLERERCASEAVPPASKSDEELKAEQAAAKKASEDAQKAEAAKAAAATKAEEAKKAEDAKKVEEAQKAAKAQLEQKAKATPERAPLPPAPIVEAVAEPHAKTNDELLAEITEELKVKEAQKVKDTEAAKKKAEAGADDTKFLSDDPAVAKMMEGAPVG